MMKRKWLTAVGIALWALSPWCQATAPSKEVQRGQATRQFFGELRGDYILPNQPLYEQFGEALSGPPDPERTLPDGSTLVAGCRYKSCIEKGAMVLGPDGAVQVAGLIHYQCHPMTTSKSGYDCKRQAKLTIFEPSRVVSTEAVQAIRAWGQDKMASAVPEIVTVPTPRASR